MNVMQGSRIGYGTYNQQSTTMVPQQGPSTTINLGCTVNFTVDAQGIVRRWVAEGNHCVAD